MSISSKSNGWFIAALVGVVITAALVFYHLATQGHAAYNGDNLGLHWTFPIIVYDYFLLTSTGLAMVAALSLMFGGAHCQPLVKRCLWLALAGLAGGVAVLFLELGHPLRAMWAIPTSFAFTSPLWWKVMAVIIYVLLLLFMFFMLNRKGASTVSHRFPATLLLMAALAVTGIAGVVYGSMTMRPFWSSGDVPVAFIFESLLGGLAFAMFFTYLAYGFTQERMEAPLRAMLTGLMPSLLALAIFIHLMFVVARAMIGLYSNAEGLQVWYHIVSSPLFYFEVIGGLLLPLLLMLIPTIRNNSMIQAMAALLVMVALFISRYEYIIGGQLVPLFKGASAPALLHYMPSVTEWLLLALAIFIANTINSFGEQKLDLSTCR